MSAYPDSAHENHQGPHPSTSNHPPPHLNGHKRRPTVEFPNGDLLPLSDRNAWYYPSLGHDSDEEELSVGLPEGNWGHKNTKGARWVRRGKITAWGPEMEDWEAEQRARKRIKLLLPQERRSPSPPTLPHLARTPSPPLVSPYPAPNSHHLNYSTFVLDKSITHTFRSSLLDELEHATNGLIEGEATMKRALGRLWQVMSEDPDEKSGESSVVPKREDEDEDADDLDDQARRVARAPDLIPATHKIFLTPYPTESSSGTEPQYNVSETQFNSLEKNLATLRELQDDGREYVERLQEIREGLGDVRAQRNTIWNMVRERAIKELQDAAFATVAATGP
ncbi:hypothetical protein JR316_0001179 [Psilocybe cubensis]|uniref:Transcriptional regulatory protein RXT2 N-terminal domain-containing protein n=2 Tax=Psilocybe cubensis TaxID=181762 RepID=A0A8H8CQY6_PSICU|nr:hypothetical protein JR316_0001179 [Psilocybe cubensis]KAH9487111.1 hypothetical protein JR316_0001179 [Psilocybe cubensis]